MLIKDLVRSICPEFPADRSVKETQDRVSWYRWSTEPCVMRVPPLGYLKSNLMELDRCCEAIQAFAVSDIQGSNFVWDNLNLAVSEGLECLEGFRKLKEDIKGKRVAVDIETRRVEYEDNRFLSIGFSLDANSCHAFYNIPIPGARYDGASVATQTQDAVLEAFRECMLLPDTTYIWHNGKFDRTRLKYLVDVDARVDEDTMIKHYACVNEKKGTHGLKALGQLYLQAPPWDDKLDEIKRDWCKKNKVKLGDFMYDDIPTEILIPYMQRDCVATYRLNDVFDGMLRPGSEFVYKMLIKATDVYGRMELNGLMVNIDYLEDLEWKLDTVIDDNTRVLDEAAKKIWDPLQYAADTGAKSIPKDGFNVGSPKQLKWMIEKLVGHPIPSTDAVTIDGLTFQEGSLAGIFITAMRAVRKNSKYLDTYVQGIRTIVCRDHRVRSSYNLHGTETGRLSSSGPNVQNIPRNKDIKNLFVATPGYRFVQFDYSQAELRVLAMMSEDPFMQKSYQDGKDFHDAVAEDMFGPGFDKEQRNLAKTINFGIAYGRGPGSIAEKFGKSMSEAKAIIDKWFKPMPKVKEYMTNQRRKATVGEPCTTPIGRERHFVVTNENLNHVQNEYINTPIQSLASDFTMLSMLAIDDWLQESKTDARIVITVHDSIILEVADNDDLVSQVVAKGVEIMEKTPGEHVECAVPFKADADHGYKWGEMSKWGTTS